MCKSNILICSIVLKLCIEAQTCNKAKLSCYILCDLIMRNREGRSLKPITYLLSSLKRKDHIYSKKKKKTTTTVWCDDDRTSRISSAVPALSTQI